MWFPLCAPTSATTAVPSQKSSSVGAQRRDHDPAEVDSGLPESVVDEEDEALAKLADSIVTGAALTADARPPSLACASFPPRGFGASGSSVAAYASAAPSAEIGAHGSDLADTDLCSSMRAGSGSNVAMLQSPSSPREPRSSCAVARQREAAEAAKLESAISFANGRVELEKSLLRRSRDEAQQHMPVGEPQTRQQRFGSGEFCVVGRPSPRSSSVSVGSLCTCDEIALVAHDLLDGRLTPRSNSVPCLQGFIERLSLDEARETADGELEVRRGRAEAAAQATRADRDATARSRGASGASRPCARRSVSADAGAVRARAAPLASLGAPEPTRRRKSAPTRKADFALRATSCQGPRLCARGARDPRSSPKASSSPKPGRASPRRPGSLGLNGGPERRRATVPISAPRSAWRVPSAVRPARGPSRAAGGAEPSGGRPRPCSPPHTPAPPQRATSPPLSATARSGPESCVDVYLRRSLGWVPSPSISADSPRTRTSSPHSAAIAERVRALADRASQRVGSTARPCVVQTAIASPPRPCSVQTVDHWRVKSAGVLRTVQRLVAPPPSPLVLCRDTGMFMPQATVRMTCGGLPSYSPQLCGSPCVAHAVSPPQTVRRTCGVLRSNSPQVCGSPCVGIGSPGPPSRPAVCLRSGHGSAVHPGSCGGPAVPRHRVDALAGAATSRLVAARPAATSPLGRGVALSVAPPRAALPLRAPYATRLVASPGFVHVAVDGARSAGVARGCSPCPPQELAAARAAAHRAAVPQQVAFSGEAGDAFSAVAVPTNIIYEPWLRMPPH